MCGCWRARGRADLAQETLGADDGGQLGAEDLDGDLALVAEVVREVDRGHAALAELALQAVAIGQAERSCWGGLTTPTAPVGPPATLRSKGGVVGQVDGGHAALAELALDLVGIGQDGLQATEEIGHWPACEGKSQYRSPCTRRLVDGPR